jgi:hypothetical protein
MVGQEQIPRNDQEMMAQGTKAYARSAVLSMWMIGKLLRLVIKLIKGVFRMVFRRKKADKSDPSFMSGAAARQMEAFNQQLQMQGYPFQQPQMQQGYPNQQPQMQQGYPYGVQQQPQPGAPAQPQPMMPQMQQPMPTAQQYRAETPSILEQLMQADMGLAEHLKSMESRISVLEEQMQRNDLNVNEIFARLNMAQGVQPAGGKVTKFHR